MNAHGLDPDPYSILGRIQDPDPPLKWKDPKHWKSKHWAQFLNGSGWNICAKINILWTKILYWSWWFLVASAG